MLQIPLRSLTDWQRYARWLEPIRRRRNEIEARLVAGGCPFVLEGFCYVCGKRSRFEVRAIGPDHPAVPDWRESLNCEQCRLQSRVRGSAHLFSKRCRPKAGSAIYLTEQRTKLYKLLKKRYPKLVGSEYLGEAIPFGSQTEKGVRNESLTGLTFPDASFDHVLCFEVMEHIPDYQKAFREIARCLKPGGTLLFTVPFLVNSERTLVRARLDDTGNVEHILPPEYHGDPVNSAGCLCLYHFGWELLTDVRNSGFRTCKAVIYWSRHFGYLGEPHLLFVARR